jgi:hypothetical protein
MRTTNATQKRNTTMGKNTVMGKNTTDFAMPENVADGKDDMDGH